MIIQEQQLSFLGSDDHMVFGQNAVAEPIIGPRPNDILYRVGLVVKHYVAFLGFDLVSLPRHVGLPEHKYGVVHRVEKHLIEVLEPDHFDNCPGFGFVPLPKDNFRVGPAGQRGKPLVFLLARETEMGVVRGAGIVGNEALFLFGFPLGSLFV